MWNTVTGDRDREQVAWGLWAWPRIWATCNEEYIAELRAVFEEATTVICKSWGRVILWLEEEEGAMAATDCTWLPRDFCLAMSYFEIQNLEGLCQHFITVIKCLRVSAAWWKADFRPRSRELQVMVWLALSRL